MTILLWALVALWLGISAFATWLVTLHLKLRLRPRPEPAAWPPVWVLAPVRVESGVDVAGYLAALAALDYPRWQLVCILEDADDPTHAAIAAFCAAAPGQRRLVLAGPTSQRAQKLHNMLAALPLVPADAVLVTLDADTCPSPLTLRRLLRPIAVGAADLATGYRWLVPQGGLGAQLACWTDLAIATLPRLDRLSIAWGGATAISPQARLRLDLPALWDRAVSDDFTLTAAVRRLGLVMHAPYEVRLTSPVRWTLGQAFEFVGRQYRMVWLHAPWHWALALGTYAVPLLGGVAMLALAWGGTPAALLAWPLAWALQLWRRRLRARVQGPAPHALAAPLALLFALAAVLAAPRRQLIWAGREYRLGREARVIGLRLVNPGAASAN